MPFQQRLSSIVPCIIPYLFLAVSALQGSEGPRWIADDTISAESATRGTPPVDDCSVEGGVLLDDGTDEAGFSWVPSAIDGVYAQTFEADLFRSPRLEEVCVCWRRSSSFPNGGDDTIDFEVVLYESMPNPSADPDVVEACPLVPNLEPVAAIPATASGVRVDTGSFTRVDLSQVSIPDGTFYLGVRWNPSVERFFFVCSDQTPSTPLVEGFFIDDRAEFWGNTVKTTDPIFADHRALLIRAVAGAPFVVEIPTSSPAALIVLGLLLISMAIHRLRS